jgi:hypothetical protein
MVALSRDTIPPVTKKKTVRRINVWTCACERCGHGWTSTGEKAPERCASCKSRYWDVPRGTLKRGPKPREAQGAKKSAARAKK